MMLEFSQRDAEILRSLIRERLEELGPEIHHTRTAEMKDELKDLRTELRSLLSRLSET